MIFSDVETHYISSHQDSRLVRYDVIKTDDDTYVVKVIDNKHQNRALPHYYLEIATLVITRDDFNLENNIGSASVVRNRMPTTFSGHVLVKCQQHRDSLD